MPKSHDKKLHDEKSYSETKSSPHSSDKTVAFLAALQETQNVLNVLLQAVLYRENADSYEGNNLEITTSLESDEEFKENISDQHSNEDKRNGNELEKKVFQLSNKLKDEEEQRFQLLLEANNTSCEDVTSGKLKEQEPLLLTEYDSNKDLNHGIPAETTNISKVEEIEKLLLFSQTKYISCEKKVNTILNEINQIHDDTRYDAACSDPLHGTTQSALEPGISNIQQEILVPDDSDHRKATVLQLPPESFPNSPSRCEKEVVGDDVAKTKTHIICECEQPGVAGGAVPMVTSFTVYHDNIQQDNNPPKNKFEDHNMPKPDLTQKEPIQQQPKCSHIPKLKHSVKDAYKIGALGRTGKERCLISASTPENHNKDEGNQSNKILLTSKMLTLQERLRATTSLIRQKISNSGENEEEKKKKDQNEKLQLRFDEESVDRGKRQKKLRNELSKSIKSVARDIAGLKELTDLSAQTLAIDNLYKCIKDLKRLSDELNDIADDEKTFAGETSQDISQDSSLESGYTAKTKDNKIYIKFLPTKLGVKKRKYCNNEVQTESKGYHTASESESPTPEKKSNGENGIKDVDSMDGMFIPSSEPPRIYEDEDEEGLDITITFPEFQQDVLHEANSHLSVSFSDISAEALGRLKRCPKEFTLRMDFVHGKMFFQSGKSPANNFSIGPDLKITEYIIDNEMSDIISIKPSTECMYTSQLIPVEGNKRKTSIRTLKSTDSELFNVVSLPTINRKASGNTKSCITFKNDRYISAGSLLSERRSYRSMPQIPSLTRILEEPAIESASTSRAAVMNSEKKSRNRTLPKKKTNASLENLSEV